MKEINAITSPGLPSAYCWARVRFATREEATRSATSRSEPSQPRSSQDLNVFDVERELKVTGRRMPIPGSLLSPNGLGHRTVKLQGSQGGPSCGADSHDSDTAPPEMGPPGIAARIEQRNLGSGLRISAGLPCALSERGGNTGQCEVVERRSAAGVDRHHMINVEGRLLASLRQTAVFAAAPRSLNNLPSQVGRNDHAVRQTDAVNVPSAAAAAKEGRRDPPILPPRVSPPESAAALGPACPAVPEATSRPLWATETEPDRPAFQLQVEWLEAYSSSISAPQCNRRPPSFPSAEMVVGPDYRSPKFFPL